MAEKRTEELTKQQKMVVNDRGGNLLVSAAAGSGKTKVLVDRLLSYITQSNGQINIDDFLIITFTHAAAAELRGKIAEKLNERLAEDPSNRHLQRQLQRLYMAKISTVHSFCSDILREYAYRLDIPSDFRMADDMECDAMKLQILDKILEKSYEEADEDFLFFLDSQELGRNDGSIPSIVLQVYDSAQCHMDPKGWLEACVAHSDMNGITDVSQTIWGQYLIKELHQQLDWQIESLENCVKKAENNGTMESLVVFLREYINRLSALRQMNNWDDIVNHKQIEYGKIQKPKGCNDPDLYERIKLVRAECKKEIDKKLTPFADLSERVIADLKGCEASLRGLTKFVNRFSDEYSALKRSRRVLDFGDLEHKMLDLLLGKSRQGITAAAEEISRRFVEVMVDEYQDTNEVQDAIFSALTHKRHNCFMVGDVKQAIYQFRLADPNIFLDKYSEYVPAEQAQPGQGRKIMLSSNFRSAGPVIEAVNDVFRQSMSPCVGGLYYDNHVQLNEGILHIENTEPEVEFCAIDVQSSTYEEEAEFVANRIVELLDGTHMVRNRDTLRPIVADDIVILLRAPKSTGAFFRYALESKGVRTVSESGFDLLQTEEISFLRAMLQIIHNPLQDIPLITALTSKILHFTGDDLARIRSENPRSSFYASLRASQMEKVASFLNILDELRQESRLLTVSQLVNKLMEITHLDSIYAAFDDGNLKKSNIQAFVDLIAKCETANISQLSRFLDYLETLEKDGFKVSGEQRIPGAVTILSIHKSKGLEFPVVFLPALSRMFNMKFLREKMVCHKELGIGFYCLDLQKRIRYPSVARKAVTARMRADFISEEIRLLYVAMTRARDRLIMTFADNKLENTISSLVKRMDLCHCDCMNTALSNPGTWVLKSALRHTEAGELFALGGYPDHRAVSNIPWAIKVVKGEGEVPKESGEVVDTVTEGSDIDIQSLSASLHFTYPYADSVSFPSKQTATQLKGRYKDFEAAENAAVNKTYRSSWREPSFVDGKQDTAVSFGNAMHSLMQHISFAECDSIIGIEQEIARLTDSGFLSPDMTDKIAPDIIWNFFSSDFGVKLRTAANVIREFKFSILDSASHYNINADQDKVLLQGVVDCAIIDPDGIHILDFKTDKVSSETVSAIAEQYKSQVLAYAEALSKIYGLPVKSAHLYFFRINQLYSVI